MSASLNGDKFKAGVDRLFGLTITRPADVPANEPEIDLTDVIVVVKVYKSGTLVHSLSTADSGLTRVTNTAATAELQGGFTDAATATWSGTYTYSVRITLTTGDRAGQIIEEIDYGGQFSVVA